jgi:hypothetical protein
MYRSMRGATKRSERVFCVYERCLRIRCALDNIDHRLTKPNKAFLAGSAPLSFRAGAAALGRPLQ